MRTDLDPKLASEIKAAFLGLKKGTPDGDAVLKPFKAEGFGGDVDMDDDIIRDIRKNVSGN